MALTTVDKVKQFIGITSTTDDTLFDILVPAVDSAIKRYLDRDIESTNYVDYYGGNNSQVLLLNEYPVTSVTEVREDSTGFYGTVSGSFASGSILTNGTDYALDISGRNQLAEFGRLIRINGVWPGRYEYKHGKLTAALKPGIGNIKVTYTAGYAAVAVPKDILLAFWQICAQIRIRRKNGLLPQSESLAEYSYSLQQVASQMVVGEAAQLLSRYRRVRQRYKVLS